MKNFYCLFIVLFLLSSRGIAQDDCCTAFPLSDNSTLFFPSSAGSGTPEDLSACSCLATDEHDSFWFSFECTSSGTFEMMITPENLGADFDFALYEGGCPCDNHTSVVSCDYTGPINPPGPFVETGISSTPNATFGVPGLTEFQATVSLVAGTTYYIIADNITTNGAGFTIQFAGTAGMGPAPIGPQPPLTPLEGDLAPCPGVPFNYNVPANPAIAEYEWTVDPSGPAIAGNGTNSVDVTWDAAGVYTLCVTGTNGCNMTPPSCVGVVVLDIIGDPVEDIICLDGTYEAPDGQTFYSPGLYDMVFTSYQGCDSIVPLLLNLAPTAINIFVEEICEGECYQFAGETFCETGIYEEILQTWQGCDSTVVLNLIVFPTEAIVLGAGPISCNGDPVVLDGSTSIGGINMIYEWADENGNILGSDDSLVVTTPGDYTLTITGEVGLNTCSDSETVTVDDSNDPPENITATGGTITCTTTSITLMGNSTTSGVTYQWSGPGGFNSNDQNPTASNVGIYTLTVTGPNGCTGTETAEIDGDSNIPDASATGDTLDCANTSVTIMGNSTTNGVAYQWSGPGGFNSNDQNPSVNEPGTYTLTVTSPNGCSAQASALVEEDTEAPDASADGGGIDCVNPSLTLTGNSTTAGVTYSWTGPNSFNSNDQNPTVNAGGTYTLTVTASNGCTSSANAVVDQNADLPDVSAMGGMVDCENTTLTLSGNSNTPGVTYDWVGPNFISNEQNPDVTDPGTYTLTVTAANGCSATATATVTQDINAPDAAGSGGTITCTTGSITLSGNSTTPNVTYTWTGPGGNTFNEQNPTVAQIGTYTLTVTASNGCTSTATADVLQDAGVPDVDAVGGTLNCNVNSVTISGNSNTPGVTYSWTGPGGFSSTLTSETVSVSGDYVLTVTAQNNCTAQATAVVLLDDELPDFNVEGDTLSCADPQVTLSSAINTPGATFEWNGPSGFTSNQPNPIVTEAGDYILTVTGSNGCSDDAIAEVLEDVDIPNVSATGGTFNCSFPDVTLQGGSTTSGVTYEWTGPNGFNTNVLDTAVTEAGDYVLTVTAANGCSSTATAVVIADLDPPLDVDAFGGILSCTANSLMLTGSSSTPNVQYFWTGPGGFASFEQNPSVAEPGTYQLTVTGQNGCEANDQAVVGQDANAPDAMAVGATLSCNEPSVQISGSSTTQGASYSWTGPGGFFSPQQNPMVSLGGIYTLSVTAPNGCITEATADVTEDLNEPQNVEATGGTLNCLTSSLTISGSSSSPNVTYEWSGPGGFTSDQVNTDVSMAGTYTLTVTGENGCTATTTAEVENDSNAPTATVNGGEVTCDNPTVSLNGQSTTAISFEWAGPGGFTSTEANPMVSTPGVYTLIVTAANGCTGSVDAEVLQNNTPPGATAVGGLITCQQPSISLQGSSPASGVTYSWSGPGGFSSTDQSPSVSVAGDYTLTVIAANGCTSSAIAIVDIDADVPIVTAGGGMVTCLVTQIQLTGSADQVVTLWEWTGPNGFTSNDQNPGNITVPGTYTLTITTGNGCSASTNAFVEEDIDLPAVIIAPAEMLTCDMETVVLDASGSDNGAGFDINWTTANGNIISGQNTLTPEVNEAGTYILEIINQANGCQDNASVNISTNGDTPSSLSIFIDDDFCFGANEGVLVVESVEGGTPPYLYALNGGIFGTDNIFSGLAPGNHQITVQDAFGCEYSDSFPIDAPTELQVSLTAVGLGVNPIPLGDDVELVVDLNISTSDVASINWTPETIMAGCDEPCLSIVVTPDETTFYAVTVADSSGCSASADLLVSVDNSRPVYVPNAFSPNDDKMNDLLVIFGGKSVNSIKSFLIFSRWGEVVFQGYNLPHSNFDFGWDGTYRGEILDPGVYTWFAEVEFKDGEVIMYEGDVTLIR